MDDDAGPPSLFVVVHSDGMEPPYFSILQIETQELQQLEDRPSIDQIKKIKLEEEKYIIRFNQEPHGRPRIRWLFSPPTSFTEDLYLVPNWGYAGFILRTVKPFAGFKFNLGTGMCQPIPPPLLSSELEGRVVNLGGRIYLMGYDSERCKHSVFQCYDPDKKLWEALEPLPSKCAGLGRIVATAALGNTILLNLAYSYIWAYDVIKNKWYEICVADEGCYLIEGEAVAVGDTIYALTREPFLVLALYIEKNPNNGDHVLICSSKKLVPGMVPINDQDDREILRRTRHLVHLGKDNFCLVQSCNLYDFSGSQEIKLTYVRLEGVNLVIVKERVHEVKFQPTGQVDQQYDVLLCFALPKGATAACKEGKIFNLEPFPEDNDSSQRNITDEQLEGCPPKLRETLEMGSKKVAPPMMMYGGCPVTSEQRLTDITQGECNRRQEVGSSLFGQNEMKNNGGLKSEISGLENEMEIVTEQLENLQKEEKSLENTMKNLLKCKDSIVKDMMEAKEMLDFINKSLQGGDESNKMLEQKSSMSPTTTEYEKDQEECLASPRSRGMLEETHKVEEDAIDSKDEKASDQEECLVSPRSLGMLEEIHRVEEEAKDEKKQASDQPGSEGTAGHETVQVSLKKVLE